MTSPSDNRPDANLNNLVRSMISYDLSVASLLNSIAVLVDDASIDSTQIVECFRELRQIVDQVLGHGPNRDEWRYKLVHLLLSNKNDLT